jgi:hypothetical protein
LNRLVSPQTYWSSYSHLGKRHDWQDSFERQSSQRQGCSSVINSTTGSLAVDKHAESYSKTGINIHLNGFAPPTAEGVILRLKLAASWREWVWRDIGEIMILNSRRITKVYTVDGCVANGRKPANQLLFSFLVQTLVTTTPGHILKMPGESTTSTRRLEKFFVEIV